MEDISSSSDIEDETAKALQRLEKQISPWAHKNVVTKPVVRIGKAYQQIIQLALESQTDLVVMGVRGRNALDLAVFGSTTYACPVRPLSGLGSSRLIASEPYARVAQDPGLGPVTSFTRLHH